MFLTVHLPAEALAFGTDLAADHADRFAAFTRISAVAERGREDTVAAPVVDDLGYAQVQPLVLQLVAPAHALLALHHVDHALHRSVMVRAGLRLRMDHHRAGPELLGAGARVGDRRGAVHAGRLRRVDVELGAFDDAHAVELP